MDTRRPGDAPSPHSSDASNTTVYSGCGCSPWPCACVSANTRLPGYARGKVGTIARVHGSHVFADTHAHGQGEQPQPLYTVVFDASELWGEGAVPGLRVSIDAWQPYLAPA